MKIQIGAMKYLVISVAVFLCLFFNTVFVFASEGSEAEPAGPALKQAVSDENSVKIYVRAAGEAPEASYQIGNMPVDSLICYGISEDDEAMRTLILLDNSNSIPKELRDPIRELIHSIVDAHSENEVFRLATYSDQISYLSDVYSNDYTALKNVVSSITYNHQKTYLTDVLYEVIADLNKEAYMGYTRIVIISDGVDSKQLGITREELNSQLKDTLYPIYSVGILTGNNHKQLEAMFALSRISSSGYCVLGDTGTEDIVSDIAGDGSISVFEASIPSSAKTGGKQSSKLVLSDGTEMVFDVTMPFQGNGETAQPPQDIEEEEPSDSVAMPPQEGEKKSSVPVILGIVIGVIILIIIAVVMIVILRKKKRSGINEPAVRANNMDDSRTEMIDRETQMIGEDDSGILPPGANKKITYKVTLSSKNDLSRTYQCELKNSISIGRVNGNDIVIEAGTISKKHCMITNRNGRIFIQDLNSTNGTFVNGERINFETEIFSGTTVRVGKTDLIAKFEQV